MLNHFSSNIKIDDAIIECVPNFSEGRDKSIITEISKSILSVKDVKILHTDIGADANRTVITFAGSPEGIEKAAFLAVKKSAELIDMRKHKGTHPRIGACDVLPLIPISGISLEKVVQLSHRLTQRIGKELKIPVYNYENSARKPERKRLETIRKGEYENLEKKLSNPEWQSDNEQLFNARTGATILGARPFLLAYNINLNTRNVNIAKDIAAAIRESGYMKNGIQIVGKFKDVKAIGWDVPEYGIVQVSTNITNIDNIGFHDVFEEVKRIANTKGVDVLGSELIGLTPKKCLIKSGKFYCDTILTEKEYIDLAIKNLGLCHQGNFKTEERIIEYLL